MMIRAAKRGNRLYKSWSIAESILIVLALVFATSAGGELEESYTSGWVEMAVEDADNNTLNDTRYAYTTPDGDDDDDDNIFLKRNRDVLSRYRVTLDTTIMESTVRTENIRYVRTNGAPPGTVLSRSEFTELQEDMLAYGSITYKLYGNGSMTWVIYDIPGDIDKVVLDDVEAELGREYEWDGENLSVAISMSSHELKVIFETAVGLGVASMSVCLAVVLILAVIIFGFVWYKREMVRRKLNL